VAVHTVASSSSSPQLATQEIAREVEQIALECRRYLFLERQRITEPVKVAVIRRQNGCARSYHSR
jgi:hypothetical protein